MLSRAWNFVKRNRRKFVITTAVIGGSFLFGRYTLMKFKEWEEKEMNERREVFRRDTHFENTQKTCHSTVLALLPNLKDSIVVLLDSDGLTSVLQMKPVNKVQVWEELKIVAFSRAVSTIYGTCMLVCLLEVQMSVLGGYLYVDAIHNINNESSNCPVSQEMQQKFLESVEHFMNDGLAALVDSVKTSVKEVVGPVSLKDKLTLADTERIFGAIERAFETNPNNPIRDLAAFLLPCTEHCEDVSSHPGLDQIMGEARDILDSDDFRGVMTLAVKCGYAHLSDWLAGYFGECGKKTGDGLNFVNPHGVAMPLAKLIPSLNNLIFSQCSVSEGQLPQMLLQLEDVKLLAGNIHEAFSQPSRVEDVQNHNSWFSRLIR